MWFRSFLLLSVSRGVSPFVYFVQFGFVWLRFSLSFCSSDEYPFPECYHIIKVFVCRTGLSIDFVTESNTYMDMQKCGDFGLAQTKPTNTLNLTLGMIYPIFIASFARMWRHNKISAILFHRWICVHQTTQYNHAVQTKIHWMAQRIMARVRERERARASERTTEWNDANREQISKEYTQKLPNNCV